MAIDEEKIAFHIKGILEALGDDTNRDGIVETPQRVARMYSEVFEGMNYSNKEIATMFDKSFDIDINSDSNDLVLVKDIDAFSYCEHHLALIYDMKISVAYIPNGKVLGLSKIARVVDMASKRLQLQERLGNDIAEIIEIMSNSSNVAVIIEACHSCMTARGIRKTTAKTYTTTYKGKFKTDGMLQMQIK